MSVIKKGDRGTFPRSAPKEKRRTVEITAVNDDATLNLQGTGPNIGEGKESGKTHENPNPWTADLAPAEEFVPEGEVEPEPTANTNTPT